MSLEDVSFHVLRGSLVGLVRYLYVWICFHLWCTSIKAFFSWGCRSFDSGFTSGKSSSSAMPGCLFFLKFKQSACNENSPLLNILFWVPPMFVCEKGYWTRALTTRLHPIFCASLYYFHLSCWCRIDVSWQFLIACLDLFTFSWIFSVFKLKWKLW